MKKNKRRTLWVVMGLILLTGVAMVIAGHTETSYGPFSNPHRRSCQRTGGPCSHRRAPGSGQSAARIRRDRYPGVDIDGAGRPILRKSARATPWTWSWFSTAVAP